MYLLLILVHSLFIFISHLFWYFIMEVVFSVLLLFFLLYFSPIFFFKNIKADKYQDLFTLDISPQNSLVIPIVLTYLAIYVLTFTFSGNIANAIHLHIVIFLAIFIIFWWYILAFNWKKKVFFDILRFHLLFSYITLIFIGMYYFFFREFIIFLDVIFSVVVLFFSYLYFNNNQYQYKEFLYTFLISVFLLWELVLLFFFKEITLYVLVWILLFFGILLFEWVRYLSFFENFLKEARIFFLILILIFVLSLSILLFFHFSVIYFLMWSIIFLISVHIRFFNIVAYISGISLVYLLYIYLFHSLLVSNSLLFVLVFMFFLPLILIGNTYFWKEKQKYDFIILHYSSIGFVILVSLYVFFFISWWERGFIFTSLTLLLLAILFFLSYFRFYKK